MTSRKSKPQNTLRGAASNARRPDERPRNSAPLVSGRWLLAGLAITILAAVFCAWCALCLLFWQGSWQLLYHPAAAVRRTPASAGLAFDPVDFATTDSGVAQLSGWWIPSAAGSPFSRYTVLFFHGQSGNLGDTVDALARLHAVGVNVFAFDYRGYGRSEFVRPSEARWLQDADWALDYLIATRHVNPGAIVLAGEGLGANLALEVAAAHSSLAGVVLDTPIDSPMNSVFSDARARPVPGRLLLRDRYDLDAPARDLRISSLWIEWLAQPEPGSPHHEPEAYQKVQAHKMLVWLNSSDATGKPFEDSLSRWLDSLEAH